MQYSFPTVFAFDNSWHLIDKLKGARRILKEGYVPEKDVQIPQDVFVIDLNYYYNLFEKIRNE
jgi:hypothetical protein